MTLLASEGLNAKWLDARDRQGHVPLHYAAWHGHVGCVELLLRQRANPDEMSHEGLTPLMLCAGSGAQGATGV
jgi:ankyrin repeat protein